MQFVTLTELEAMKNAQLMKVDRVLEILTSNTEVSEATKKFRVACLGSRYHDGSENEHIVPALVFGDSGWYRVNEELCFGHSRSMTDANGRIPIW